jgi:hypothetical protein
MKTRMLSVFLLLLSSLSLHAVADVLYAVDGAGGTPSTLYELDAATGAVIQTIGPTGLSAVTGIAFHPDTGVLYGVMSGLFHGTETDLVTIDINTGVSTVIGSHGSQIPDIGFDSNGTLYGWVEAPTRDSLITLNLTTGAATLVGSSAAGNKIGLAFDSSDNLYMKNSVMLHTLDANTGSSTGSVSVRGSQHHNALAFDSADTLYSLYRDKGGSGATLLTIDPVSGAITAVGSNSISTMSAIAFQGIQAPAGPQGPPGPQGETGPQGEGLMSGSLLLLPDDVPAPEGYTVLGSYRQDFKKSKKSKKHKKPRKSGKPKKSSKNHITIITYQRD